MKQMIGVPIQNLSYNEHHNFKSKHIGTFYFVSSLPSDGFLSLDQFHIFALKHINCSTLHLM